MSCTLRPRSDPAAECSVAMPQDAEHQHLQQHQHASGTEEPREPSNLQGDYHNVALLLVLYTLQGIPMGFSAAVPLILKERGATFSDIALFSVCSLPFSAKLFWAPIVDSVYSEKVGRRKTWLLPTQLLIGAMMLYVAARMPVWLGEGEGHGKLQIVNLTFCYLVLYVCCATQDIAVDGWALTMLKRRNVGYASTCNTIGQTLGYFEAFVLIMALVEPGYVSFSTFTVVHGVLFIVITVFVFAVKREDKVRPTEEVDSAKTVYYQMAQTMELPAVKELVVILLTWKVSSAVAENLTILKMQEQGMPKEHAAALSLILTPVQSIIPMIVTKFTAGDRPLDLAVHAYLPRTVFAAFSGVVLVYFAPTASFAAAKQGHSIIADVWPFYVLMLLLSGVYSVFAACMFVSQMAFFAKVSDPRIGGTYMTLLNTVANLGNLAAKMGVTYAVDMFTWRSCVDHENRHLGTCEIMTGETNDPACALQKGTCTRSVDGYYVVLAGCFVFGVWWWVTFKTKLDKLQTRKQAEWRVTGGKGSLVWLSAMFAVVFMMLLPALRKLAALY